MINNEFQIIHLPETESTNLSLRCMSRDGNLPNTSIVWADFQTKGRGQAGNSWESESGRNLLCSILYYPASLSAGQPFVVAELASLSAKYTLDRYVSDISIKWPNDIYWKDKKMGGLLIENEIAGDRIVRSIIGIGINLNQSEFKSGAPNPVSLTQITGCTCDRMDILKQLHANFRKLVGEFDAGCFELLHQNYCAALYGRDGFYPYTDSDGCFEASIHTIEPSGHLLLKRRDGTLSRYAFKEVERVHGT